MSTKNADISRRRQTISGTETIHKSIANYALDIFKKIRAKKQNLKLPERPEDLKQVFLNISLDAYKKVLA